MYGSVKRRSERSSDSRYWADYTEELNRYADEMGRSHLPRSDDIVEMKQENFVSSETINDCEIISREDDRAYAEFIEANLRARGLRVDLLFPIENISSILAKLTARGTLYCIEISELHEKQQLITVHVLQGVRQEHRNMPLKDALAMVVKDFMMKVPHRFNPVHPLPTIKQREENVRDEIMVQDYHKMDAVKIPEQDQRDETSKVPETDASKHNDRSSTGLSEGRSSGKKLPEAMRQIFQTLIDEKDMSLGEFDKAIKFLMTQRDALAVQLDVPTLYIDQAPRMESRQSHSETDRQSHSETDRQFRSETDKQSHSETDRQSHSEKDRSSYSGTEPVRKYNWYPHSGADRETNWQTLGGAGGESRSKLLNEVERMLLANKPHRREQMADSNNSWETLLKRHKAEQFSDDHQATQNLKRKRRHPKKAAVADGPDPQMAEKLLRLERQLKSKEYQESFVKPESADEEKNKFAVQQKISNRYRNLQALRSKTKVDASSRSQLFPGADLIPIPYY